MPKTESVVDSSILNELKSLLGGNFAQLLNTYLGDSKKRIDTLAVALSNRDYSTIHREAHGLKGSSQNIGAFEFAKTCELLEASGRLQQEEGLEKLFSAVQQQFADVCRYLNTYQ